MTAQDEPQEGTGRSSPHTSSTEHCRKVLHCPLHIICIKENRKSSHSPSPPQQLSLKAPFPLFLLIHHGNQCRATQRASAWLRAQGGHSPGTAFPMKPHWPWGPSASPILKFDLGTGLGKGRQGRKSCFKGNNLLNTQSNVLVKAELCQALERGHGAVGLHHSVHTIFLPPERRSLGRQRLSNLSC